LTEVLLCGALAGRSRQSATEVDATDWERERRGGDHGRGRRALAVSRPAPHAPLRSPVRNGKGIDGSLNSPRRRRRKTRERDKDARNWRKNRTTKRRRSSSGRRGARARSRAPSRDALWQRRYAADPIERWRVRATRARVVLATRDPRYRASDVSLRGVPTPRLECVSQDQAELERTRKYAGRLSLSRRRGRSPVRRARQLQRAWRSLSSSTGGRA